MNIEEFKKKMNKAKPMERDDIECTCRDHIKNLGKTISSVICIEELAELQKEISKKIRGDISIDSDYRMLEEIADTLIAIQELLIMYNFDDEEVSNAVAVKINRIKEKDKELEKTNAGC